VVSDLEGDNLVFYSLDLVSGKKEHIEDLQGATDAKYSWCLSSDGKSVALVRPKQLNGSIEVLNLSDHTSRKVSVEPGGGYLSWIVWAAGGKGFFLISTQPDSSNLLYVTLSGKVISLLRESIWEKLYRVLPSPDGKYLAYEAMTEDSNAWLLKNF